jgi:hypothetical protein
MPLPNGGCPTGQARGLKAHASASITTSRSRRSVPYRFARGEVEVRLTPRSVEAFLKGERVAAHLRSSGNHNHRHTTVAQHMPSSHRRCADWTVERIRRDATAIGPRRPHCSS